MNILLVLAVAAAFAVLHFRRASLLMWSAAWWVGIYVLLRFGFTAPIPAHGAQSAPANERSGAQGPRRATAPGFAAEPRPNGAPR